MAATFPQGGGRRHLQVRRKHFAFKRHKQRPCPWTYLVPPELKTEILSCPQTLRPAGGPFQQSRLRALHLLPQHGRTCDRERLWRTHQLVRVVQRVFTVEGSPEDTIFQGLWTAESFHLVSISKEKLFFSLGSVAGLLQGLVCFSLCGRWNRNVRKLIFERRCSNLQDMLFISVPQFRKALFLLTG